VLPLTLDRSILALDDPSKLALIDELRTDELLLVRRRRRRISSGSSGFRPLARAYRFSTSVKLITPLRRPLMIDPGRVEELTATLGVAGVYGGPCVGALSWCMVGGGATDPEGLSAGDGGTEEAGEGTESTIHIL